MQPDHNDEIEIDMREIVNVLLRKMWIVILAGIICALGAGIYSKVVLKPIYTSTAKVYVINRQNTETTTTMSDLQTGAQLTKDYMILIMSRPVTEQVISELELDMTHEQLVSSFTVNTPEETRIIEIVVKNPDPYIAKQLADAIATVSAERMVSVMEMQKANLVEQGNIPSQPSSPNVEKNIIIGGLAGGFIAVFAIILIFTMNDSIKSTEDIERYLGLITLGTIPIEEMNAKLQKARKLKKKDHKKEMYRGGDASNATN